VLVSTKNVAFENRLAQMLEEPPVALIGRRDVVDDHGRFVLALEGLEIDTAVPNVVRVRTHRDEAGASIIGSLVAAFSFAGPALHN